jgi:protein-tyrosine phosphatase
MLPRPRTPGAYRIAVVCLGNICRSPVAQVVLAQRVEDVGLGGRVEVTSAGTGDWHVGNAMDRRAAATLTGEGYDPSDHRARQFTAADTSTYDLVLAMDRTNLTDLERLGVPADRLRLFRDYDPVPGDGEVPDPYYGRDDGFQEVLAMVERTAAGLVRELQAQRDVVGGRAR